jgi:FKBP-type peptidyl-prolyl cis-trans isomerase
MMVLAGGITAIGTSPLDALAEETIFLQQYDDFQLTPEGWSFREVKLGEGATPNKGDRVVFDWSGYTIGYFGRPFEAKGYVV